jgi:hypothetical protein
MREVKGLKFVASQIPNGEPGAPGYGLLPFARKNEGWRARRRSVPESHSHL